MPRLKAANNAQTTLAANCTALDTVITVDDVLRFPDPPFRITVDDEIMEVTSIDYENKRFTVLRGVEGTVAAAHNVGAMVENRFTAGTYDELLDVSQLTSPGGTEANKVAKTDENGRVGDSKRLGGYPAEDYLRRNVNETVSGNWTLGDSNQDVWRRKAVMLDTDTRTVTLTFDGNGNLITVTEKDGTTTVKTTTLTYDANGRLTKVQESADGTTVTKTLNYDSNGRLTSVSKSVT